MTITAKVNYRHFRQSYLNNFLGRTIRPIRWWRFRRRVRGIGGECRAQPEPRQSGLDAVEQLGIAFLDQLQYADSVAAFNEVVKLRPDYADAYTNSV